MMPLQKSAFLEHPDARMSSSPAAGNRTAPAGATARLFAYGTLRDAGLLAAVIGKDSGWRYLGEGSVAGRLYDAGEYPVLGAREEAGDRVPGVLIELERGEDALARLDAYEGVDIGLYRRQAVAVQLSSGAVVEAWAYVYQRSVEGLRRIERWPAS
jgi:gamma-glutamylcyclotransferase (GGCT)/AIG2-like uncharacterized protein YtfP